MLSSVFALPSRCIAHAMGSHSIAAALAWGSRSEVERARRAGLWRSRLGGKLHDAGPSASVAPPRAHARPLPLHGGPIGLAQPLADRPRGEWPAFEARERHHLLDRVRKEDFVRPRHGGPVE